jgi:hypothetical protein
MGKALLEAARPPMWTIEAGVVDAAAKTVRFGRHRIALKDIAGVSLEEVRDPQAAGIFIGASAFLCVASTFAYFVFEQGARTRFLIGSFFLGALGLAGLYESSRIKRISHYELTLTLANGERVVFTSADRADIQALALRITSERGE